MFKKIKKLFLRWFYPYWKFDVVGDVLIVQVPVGKLPPSKVEEYIKQVSETLAKEKSKFGVEILYVVGYRDEFFF